MAETKQKSKKIPISNNVQFYRWAGMPNLQAIRRVSHALPDLQTILINIILIAF